MAEDKLVGELAVALGVERNQMKMKFKNEIVWGTA